MVFHLTLLAAHLCEANCTLEAVSGELVVQGTCFQGIKVSAISISQIWVTFQGEENKSANVGVYFCTGRG